MKDPMDVPLTTAELGLLRKLDGPPPIETVALSRSVHELAIRAVREIESHRAFVELVRSSGMVTLCVATVASYHDGFEISIEDGSGNVVTGYGTSIADAIANAKGP